MAEELYPHATHIVEIYHTREHLHDLISHLPFITPDPAAWLEDRSADLDTGNIDAIITAACRYPSPGSKPTSWTRRPVTSGATPTGCATSTSAMWACSPSLAPSRE